jgi:outer membrane lipoprotein carrier protein
MKLITNSLLFKCVTNARAALLLTGLIVMAPLPANANGVDRLKAFFQNTDAISANFHQTVLDNQGRKIQEVDGSMKLQRPGKFRWDYDKPYVQHIVGDGKKVWLFDPELNQVTVRDLDKALGSSPAALLAGNREMEQNFLLTYQERKDGLEWVLATPKSEDSGFERVAIGFNGDELQAMELHDSFGHTTQIKFSELQRNPKLPSATFTFTPPKNADVVGN